MSESTEGAGPIGGDSLEAPLKSYRTILRQEIAQAEEELERPARGLFLSGVLAGIGVGTSLFLSAVTLTAGDGSFSEPVLALLMANAYTVGFIIVILGRTDLFTEYTTIAILPVLHGQAPLSSLARLWGLVYVGNLLGATLFAAFLSVLVPSQERVSAESVTRIASELVADSGWAIGLGALLAGWLMGLLSWLVVAGRDTISQIFFVWLVTLTIGLGGLPHAITGSVDILTAVFLERLSLGQFSSFLLWTTLGNAIGGVLFAVLIRESHVISRGGETSERGRPRSGRGERTSSVNR